MLADWEIFHRGGALRVRIGPLLDEPIEFGTEGIFVLGARAQFVETNGQISALALTSRGARNFRLTRIMQ